MLQKGDEQVALWNVMGLSEHPVTEVPAACRIQLQAYEQARTFPLNTHSHVFGSDRNIFRAFESSLMMHKGTMSFVSLLTVRRFGTSVQLCWEVLTRR